jgi:hypothetical protein
MYFLSKLRLGKRVPTTDHVQLLLPVAGIGHTDLDDVLALHLSLRAVHLVILKNKS